MGGEGGPNMKKGNKARHEMRGEEMSQIEGRTLGVAVHPDELARLALVRPAQHHDLSIRFM